MLLRTWPVKKYNYTISMPTYFKDINCHFNLYKNISFYAEKLTGVKLGIAPSG
jgi:hypothetical protein